MENDTIQDAITENVAQWTSLATGPCENLGIGFDPSPKEEEERRAKFVSMASHVDGPLRRKIERALRGGKRSKIRRAKQAAYRYDTTSSNLSLLF
jgi:hypothetical protein